MKVFYNGVTIHRAMTTSWEETVEYDSSGMNMIGNSIRMSFEGMVYPLEFLQVYENSVQTYNNTNVQLITDAAGATGLFSYRLNALLRELAIPRGAFVVQDVIQGTTLFEAYPQRDVNGETPKTPFQLGGASLDERQKRNYDVAGGPKPISVSVAQIVNQCARIVFTIEVHKIRCLGGETVTTENQLGADPETGFVVSNRCWTEETIDDNFYTTRTFTGKLRISSTEKSVHFYRHLYYPPLEDGFRRSSVRFSESENGLELSYTVTDKQVRLAAPYPATAFSGNVSYNIINGANMQFSMNLTMIGRPDAPKKMLTARAAQAVQKKLADVSKNANGFIEKYNISENLGDPPSVTITVNVQLYAKTKGSDSNVKDKPDVAQLYSPCIDLIGDPVEFEERIAYDGVSYPYNRFKSNVPNAYGYEVFNAYPDSTEEGETDETDGSKGKTKNPEAYGFIKCIATAPCALLKPVASQTGTDSAQVFDELTTKVYKDENGVDYGSEPSNVNESVFDYPYSVYKSDITYDVDYARFVLPQAKLKESETVNAATTAEQIMSKTAELEEARERLETLKAQAEEENNGNSGGITTEEPSQDPENPQEEQTGNTEPTLEQQIEQLIDRIETLEKEIADLRNKISTTRVIEVARPIARARVVIEAERFGRLPEMPDPEAIVTTTGDDPIIFTPLKHEITLCEPRAARNNDGVSYSCIGTYEYVMSRPFKKGDEVWLLSNPTFESECYYPKMTLENGEITKDTDALTVLYNGAQLAHEDFAPKEETPLLEQETNS